MKRAITQIFTLLLLITLAVPAFAGKVLAEIEYFYSDDGTLIGKAFNGKRVNFEYDLRGQLLAVKDASGKDLERYTYDPAGNRLSKTINGVTTTYTYDKANQLVTSTVNGVTTHYKYDAAGRMIQAGDKSYIYNGQNKVSEVRQNGKTVAKFEYNIDGQIAKAIYGNKVEEFMWDGLALIWRSGVTYINEPYVTGGNPVMAGDAVLFNDMLGSTLAVNEKAVEMTSFGETDDKNAFFTGKPMIDELGYSFLFRDYNPNLGKWTTSDPLGYPDGWNNLAYVNNGVTTAIDWFGAWEIELRNRVVYWLFPYTHLSSHVTLTEDEFNRLNISQSLKNEFKSSINQKGETEHKLIISGYPTNMSLGGVFALPSNLELKYFYEDDSVNDTNHVASVSMTGVFALKQIENYLNYADAYYSRNKNDLAEYAFNIESPNEGNSNSILNTLFVLSGISIPLPENFSCHGYDHIINSSFFRRTSVTE